MNIKKSVFLIIMMTLISSAHADEVLKSTDCTTATNLKHDIQNDHRIFPAEKKEPLYFKVPTDSESKEYSIKEEVRDTRFKSEIKTILEYIKKKPSGKQPAGAQAKEYCYLYTPHYKRSTLTIFQKDKPAQKQTQKPVSTKKPNAGNDGAQANDVAKDATVFNTIYYGPIEHWYISADMPVSNIKQLKYDSSTHKVVEKETPAGFYIGINYQFGDVVDESVNTKTCQKFSLKLLLDASSKPFNSIGLGLGYRFKPFDIFVAAMRTQSEALPGRSARGNSYGGVAGLSFDLSKGIEWLKQ